MNKDDCYFLGTLIKTHGISGDFVLKSDHISFESLEIKESVFIEIDGYLVPFFLAPSGVRTSGKDALIIRFDNIDSENLARKYLDCRVFLPGIKKEEPADFVDPDQIIGYHVIDKQYGDIGIVEEIIDIPGNNLLKVLKDDKEILIPVTDDIIKTIDKQQKLIQISAPEGLIELYL